jgi:FkbH-like protein
MKYPEILAENRLLGSQMTGEQFVVRVLSNITVTPIKELLEYELRRINIYAKVELGEYDNICQNSFEINNTNAVLIFWDVANLTECFPSRVLTMDDALIRQTEEKVIAEISLVLNNLQHIPLVLFNTFTSVLFNVTEVSENALDRVVNTLNDFLYNSRQLNLQIINIDKCIAQVSLENAVDWRMWLLSRMLYSIEFFIKYVGYVSPVLKALNGAAKKVLIFDCDNTLWKGIIGEDGIEGINMTNSNKDGQPFYEVQKLAFSLFTKGVILGLCSKNNQADVDAVFEKYPDIVLKNEHFLIKKINWNNKVENIQQIGKELNLGLDSLVFIDDSEFEASLVEQFLPQITVLRVPKSLSDYPQYFRENMSLFWTGAQTDEDVKRTVMYRHQAIREQEATKFSNIDDYLRSLKLELTIFCDSPITVARIAQLTQKTNQFNMTTKRYTEADINSFVASKDCLVYAFSMSDNFGDFGLTGVAIILLNSKDNEAEIDTFLLSCRVLGRNAEIKFLDFVIHELKKHGVKRIRGSYIPTNKNTQVSMFFEARGFNVVEDIGVVKSYQLEVDNYENCSIEYITVNMGN